MNETPHTDAILLAGGSGARFGARRPKQFVPLAGKPLLACAVEALKKNEVRRIILTRPAIEAGESLGFLPGDMHAKISPYLRPLYDAIYDMMEGARIEKYLETGIIEVVVTCSSTKLIVIQ